MPQPIIRIAGPKVRRLPKRPATKPHASIAASMLVLRTAWSIPPAPMPPESNGKPSARASSIITTGITNEHPE